MEFKQIKDLLENDGYWNHLGIKLKKINKGSAELTIQLKEYLTHYQGLMHGGALASILDASVYVAMFQIVDHENEFASTIELKINYLSPVKYPEIKEVTAAANIIKRGDTIVVGVCELYEGAKMFAYGIATYAVMKKSEYKSTH